MHDMLVASAYLAMLMLPCAIAQWGHVLMPSWWEQRSAVRVLGDEMILDTDMNGDLDVGDPIYAPRSARRAIQLRRRAQDAAHVPASATTAAATPPRAAAPIAAPVPAMTIAPVRGARPSAIRPRAQTGRPIEDESLRVAQRLTELLEANRLVAGQLLGLRREFAVQNQQQAQMRQQPQTPPQLRDPEATAERVAGGRRFVDQPVFSWQAAILGPARTQQARPTVAAAATPLEHATGAAPVAAPAPVESGLRIFEVPAPPPPPPTPSEIYATYGFEDPMPQPVVSAVRPAADLARPYESSGEVSVAA